MQFKYCSLFLCILSLLALPIWAADSVSNGYSPKGKPLTMRFIEDLRISPQDSDDYIWPGELVSVEVDDKGNMFAVVPAEGHILVYDNKGTFVRKLGGKGEGPGQFQNLVSFQLVGTGAIGFESLGGISIVHYFDDQFAFKSKKRISIPNIVTEELLFGASTDVAVATGIRVDQAVNKYYNRAIIVNKAFEEQKLLFEAKPTGGFDPARTSDGQFWTEFMAGRFKPIALGETPNYAFDKAGNLYMALSRDYEITVYSPTQKILRKITKKYKPAPFTDAELEAFSEPFFSELQEQVPSPFNEMITKSRVRKALEMAKFPPGKHPIKGMKVTEQGHLLVLTRESYAKGTTWVEIFSPEGVYLGKFQRQLFEMKRMTFKNGFAYAFRQMDDDNEIVRYRYELAAGP